jgi:anthranilate synthase component 1
VSHDGIVTTRPIKGTRPRGLTPEDDQRLADELRGSDKEQAENLMIVDLMRNDLSVVCDTGTVAVPELMVVESYASVHQLVSTVTGQLRTDADLVDLIDASFPAGSMTGAPKRRAVELLAGWEQAPRGYYSGVWGVWRADGSATLAMTIRTAVITQGSMTLGVGGGITALSEPGSEIAEVGIKAMPFLRALGHAQVEYS